MKFNDKDPFDQTGNNAVTASINALFVILAAATENGDAKRQCQLRQMAIALMTLVESNSKKNLVGQIIDGLNKLNDLIQTSSLSQDKKEISDKIKSYAIEQIPT